MRSSNKIKVFLGAYVNQTNAQNLSCRALAEYLDKDKFLVYTLEIKRGNLTSLRIKGVKIFRCAYPVRLSGLVGFLWGFYNADVVYLPRGVFLSWQKLFCKVFKVRSFKTVRNVIDDQALKSAVSQIIKPTRGDIKLAYSFVDKVYSMTKFMAEYNLKRWGLVSENETLLPPTEYALLKERSRIRENLKEVLFIGNDWSRKGIDDFLELARLFPLLNFNILGRGNVSYYAPRSSDNVFYHGLKADEEFIDLVTSSDINILPSRSEGLPRVLIETLANGLPSILYIGYGAEDYINNGVNGFVLNNTLEVQEVINKLLQNQISLSALSRASLESSDQFNPKRLTKKYEQVIQDLYES